MRTSDKNINTSLGKQIRKTFFQTLTDLKNVGEVEKFLNDFFTDSEIEVFSKRLAIAYWLKKGRSYSNIKTNLKASSATIASIQSDMEKPGFQLALKKIEAEEWATQWTEKIQKFIK